eukprot:350157-Chlamydomonas_euryale.AAC.3
MRQGVACGWHGSRGSQRCMRRGWRAGGTEAAAPSAACGREWRAGAHPGKAAEANAEDGYRPRAGLGWAEAWRRSEVAVASTLEHALHQALPASPPPSARIAAGG